MATYTLALILNKPENHAEFLLLKQTSPSKFNDEEYDSHVDSDLWDLPFTKLTPLQGAESEPLIFIHGADLFQEKVDLSKFDVHSALTQVLGQAAIGVTEVGEWRLWKFVEEPEYGPGLPVHTVYITGTLLDGKQVFEEGCKWMSSQSCLNWLVKVKPSSNRVGPLVVAGLLKDLVQSREWNISANLRYQEYPPGVLIVPMRSRTRKPFDTTNLVIFAPENVEDECENCNCAAQGEALIVDPGCRTELHEELSHVIASLPRKLIVFITHHHVDHVDGLSIVQKCNPDATLLAHENTMRRIRKDDWSLGCTSVSGEEDICVGGQRLTVCFAPGHTDGHATLLHVNTNSLIVGDHCVGQGSAVLDITSGGNMADYFQTTYKLMGLSPHVLIPMHGRVNLWPKHMLCGYLKNRRSREASILKAIENGATTLFDIVADVYSEVDHSFWIPASSNVRLHVDHLAEQNKLPKEFSVQYFQKTCGFCLILRWSLAYLGNGFELKYKRLSRSVLLVAGAVAGFAVLYSSKNKLNSK